MKTTITTVLRKTIICNADERQKIIQELSLDWSWKSSGLVASNGEVLRDTYQLIFEKVIEQHQESSSVEKTPDNRQHLS